jgi:hypothetical protein
MTTVLIICACLLVYAIYKNLQTKDNTHKKDDRNIKVSILTSTDGETFHESKTIDYKSHHEQMRLRDKRRERQHTIWSVLRFMVTYKKLIEETTNFYQFRDNYPAFKIAKGEMRKRHPDTCALNTAIRFCQMEFFYGTCDHKLTEHDIQTLYNWKELNVDEGQLLNNVLSSFDSYWGEVLESYVRPSARIKRIDYLIQELDKIKDMEGVKSYPSVLDRLDQLQQRYREMLPS